MPHIYTIVKQICTFTDFRRRRPLPTPQKQHKSRKNLTNPKRIVSSLSFYNMVCVMEKLMNSHFSKTAFSSSSKSIFDDVMLIIIVKMCEKKITTADSSVWACVHFEVYKLDRQCMSVEPLITDTLINEHLQ
jgi:hypothetical protein